MKTTFEKYIEANHALVKCYEGLPLAKWSALSAAQKEDVCKVEREAVRGFLVSNQVAFANLIKERLEHAGH